MEKLDVIYERNRIYKESDEGEMLYEVRFPEKEAGIRDIDSTYVCDALKGKGIAGELVKLAAEHITAEGKKTKLSCWYAAGWFEKHPEYNDIAVK